MTEPTPPDGYRRASPPRIPERPAAHEYTGDPVGAAHDAPSGGRVSGNVPPGGPTGPGHDDSDSSGGSKKKTGLLVGGLAVLVVALLGVLAFVVVGGGDDDSSSGSSERDDEEDDEQDDSDDTEIPDTEVPDTEVVDTQAVDTAVRADGSVAGLFVRIEGLSAVVPGAELQTTLERIGQDSDENRVSTTDDVVNLCAAIPLEAPATASVEWRRDDEVVSSGAARRFETPADGNCINNNGAALDAGSYEVSFTDDAGGETRVALFTVGAPSRTQTFVNDTGIDICSIDVGPSSAGFFQAFELTAGTPLLDGESIDIDVADVEHEVRGRDCGDEPLDSFFFVPSDDVVGLVAGEVVAPSTTTTTTTSTTSAPAAEAISDIAFIGLDGEIGSLDIPIGSDAEEATVIDVLATSDERFPIATTETSIALCAAWEVPGLLEADIVWEFNRAEIARIPSTSVDDRIGVCIPPGGDEFDEGAYQVYLRRGELISRIETFTVGREETQLAFVNDTDVAICEVGFSPNLTNFYTFFTFADSSDFDEALAPGESFTFVAPFIENDIRARDCDGNSVSEAFDIPPTDQTLDLSTGRP